MPGKFVRPSSSVINAALQLDDPSIAPDLKHCIEVGVNEEKTTVFKKIALPKRGDWLREHDEKGQTMKSFNRMVMKAQPHSTYRTIYIQPIGSFESPRCPKLADIVKYAKAFFWSLDVQLLDTLDLTDPIVANTIETRTNEHTERLQISTTSLMNILNITKKSHRNPRQEIISLLVTMEDVYPYDDWNFVYGIADLVGGTGVWSFARLDPLFPARLNTPPSGDENEMILLRCIKILLHEATHLFGLKHCIYYTCLMNGANNDDEMERQPLYLCPVCIRKLQSSLKFNTTTRYQALYHINQTLGLTTSSQWYLNLMEQCNIDPTIVPMSMSATEEEGKQKMKKSKGKKIK